MLSTLTQFALNERGATALEYGLIAALVSVGAIGALVALGGSLKDVFGVVATALDDAAASATAGASP